MESINMLYDIVKHYTKGKKIELDVANKVARIEQDLEILDILNKHLFIRIDDRPSFDGTYLVALEEDENSCCDYTGIFVNGKEKDLIKEWLAIKEKHNEN